MTDYRPNDPLDPLNPVNPRSDRYLDEPGPGASWGWIVGGLVALFLVFVFVFGFSGSDRTASTDTVTPPTQTSTAPPSGRLPRRRTPAPRRATRCRRTIPVLGNSAPDWPQGRNPAPFRAGFFWQ
jgi:hypothetical protein